MTFNNNNNRGIGHWSFAFVHSYIYLFIFLLFDYFCPNKMRSIYFSIQWLHNFIDYYGKLHIVWLRAHQKKVFIYLEDMSHCCHWALSVEIWTLPIYHPVPMERGQKIPPCKVHWLKFIYFYLCSCSFCFFNRKFQHNGFDKIEKFCQYIESLEVGCLHFASFSFFLSSFFFFFRQGYEIWKCDVNGSKANTISHNFQQFIAFYYYFLMSIFSHPFLSIFVLPFAYTHIQIDRTKRLDDNQITLKTKEKKKFSEQASWLFYGLAKQSAVC